VSYSGIAQRAARAIVVVAPAIMLAVFAAHAFSYFFLYDDFVIVGEASTRTLARLVREPVVQFYRPAMYLWTRLEFALFGWAHPAGYAAASLALHALSSLLAVRLVRALGEDRATAWTAGLLFLMSPWATEPYF